MIIFERRMNMKINVTIEIDDEELKMQSII